MRKFILAVVIGAALIASAVASGSGKPGLSQGTTAAGTLVTSNTGAFKASAAKPGPEAVVGHVGAVVRDNSRVLKPGIAAAGPASVVLGKAPSFAASPNLLGYVVVNSGSLSNPNGQQSFGQVNCPTGTKAFGGGVFGDSVSLFQNVNSSFPIVANGKA